MYLLLLTACFFTDDTGAPDADGDGSADVDDCDDDDAAVYPGAPELCGDGVDHDCDGLVGACEVRFTGDSVADRAGYALSGAGDVDADGYADMLVASPGIDRNKGVVFLLRGRATPTDLNLSEADAVYTGDATNDSRRARSSWSWAAGCSSSTARTS